MSPRKMTAEKAEKAEEIKDFINRHKVIGAASLQKVRAAQLQELRRKLEPTVRLLVAKNTVMKRAIAECKDKPGLKMFEERLSGPNIFLFTDLNPFKLVFLLEKNKVTTTARAGDTAADDVLVPAGNTGFPPGPVISQLSAVGLPTRIESGSVWITRDTVAAKKGEVITGRLAPVLSRLGIEPVEVGLIMKVVYDDGILITEEQMRLDLEETRRSIEEAHAQAFNISLKAAYPFPENIASLLQMAYHETYALVLSAGIPAPDTIADLIRKAHVEMLSLSRRVAIINEKAAPESMIEKS